MVLKFLIQMQDTTADCEVSVPLRGYGFEIRCTQSEKLLFMLLFPSPCGDMVLKFAVEFFLDKERGLFPSPCGDMVLK